MSYLRHLSYMTVAKSLVLSSFVTQCDCQERTHLNSYSNRHQRRTERSLDSHYTHVILGFGTAGSSAVRELLKHGSHGDTVLIVDPVANVKKIGFPHQEDKRLVFEENQATNIDHVHRIVELADGSRIKYQNCLISVGSSAAPFNPQYVDAACDLQHTVVNLNHPNAPHNLYRELMNDSGTGELAKKGKNVALVGANSWESVELAGRLAMAAEHKHHEQVQQAVKRQKQQAQQRLKTLQSQLSTGGNNNTKNGNGAPTNKSSVGALTLTPTLSMPTKDIVSLIYPAYGPMSHSLPRYLSLALAKRLHGLGVHLVPYSYVRYLGAGSPVNTTSTGTASTAAKTNTTITANTTTTSTTSPQAVLFLAKTYDSLNTHSIIADKVTFALSSIPTVQDRELFKSQHTDPQTELNSTDKPSMNEFHPHGFLLRSGLELDRITGGVVANLSLQVCEGIYAAGDIASVYVGSGTGVDLRDSAEIGGGGTSSSEERVNPIQQRGVVRGHHNALYSGTVAGRNMAYSVSTTTNDSTSACAPLLYNHIPISEVHSADIGVHFTFVGTCSSALETHGYWWKLAEKAKLGTPVTTSAATSVSSAKGAGSTSSEASESMRPPLGLGVVFYIDNNVIAGVLVSGLPVAPLYTSTNDVRSAATGDGASNGATYTDHVHALCKSLIGKSVKSLDTYSSTSNGSKRIDISHAYEVPVDEVVSDDEAAVHKSNAISTPDTTGISTSSSTSIEGKNTASAIIAATTTAAVTNTASSAVAEVYTSQALSWEARKLISPVLSAPLYKQLATSASPTSTNTASSTLLSKQISSYPRPLYRYCGPSPTTIKDLTEPHTHAVVQPAVVREALFQPEFANTGSRADNVKTAYKRSMAKNIY